MCREACTPIFISALFTIARKWEQPGHSSVEEWIHRIWSSPQWNTVQPPKGIKHQCCNMGKPWEHEATKKPATKRLHIVWSHLYDMPGGSQSGETGGRLVVTRGWREGGRWGVTAKVMGFLWGDEIFSSWLWERLRSSECTQNTTWNGFAFYNIIIIPIKLFLKCAQ